MGFDVHGPSRNVCVSSVDCVSTADDGVSPSYDLFSLPAEFGLRCPQLEKLNQRFYETTILDNNDGSIELLREELVALREAYRTGREPMLVVERQVRVKDPEMRRAVLDRIFNVDVVFRVIEDFRRLCDEAIAAAVPLECVGD